MLGRRRPRGRTALAGCLAALGLCAADAQPNLPFATRQDLITGTASLAKQAVNAIPLGVAPPDLLRSILPALQYSKSSYEGRTYPDYNVDGFWKLLESQGVDKDVNKVKLINITRAASANYQPFKDNSCQGQPPTNTFAYVMTFKADPDSAAFIFRGTDLNPANVLTDACLSLVGFTAAKGLHCPGLLDGTNCSVSKGFQAAFTSVADNAPGPDADIAATWARLSGRDAPKSVLCTGHSLGGTLAEFCGVWAKNRWPTARVSVVSVAAPMVGNLAFAEFYDRYVDVSWRVVHGDDIVPSLPPLPGWWSVAHPLWLARQGPNNTYVALQQARPLFKNYLSVDDHWISTYISAMQYCIEHGAPSLLGSGTSSDGGR